MRYRIISLLTVLALLWVVPEGGSASTTDITRLLGRMNALGITDNYPADTYRPYNTVSRAETAVLIIRMINLDGLARSYNNENLFDDVASTHWAAGHINLAAKTGIVSVSSDRRFSPEAEINYNEIIKMLVAALGYAPLAQAEGGYPAGFLAKAHGLGLMKGAELSGEQAVNRADLLLLLNNALGAKLFKEKPPVKGFDAPTLLSERLAYLDMTIYTGVVTAQGSASLSGTHTLKRGQIEIDHTVYEAPDLAGEYLGHTVEFYVKNTGGSPYISALYATKNNRELHLEYDEIETISLAAIQYQRQDSSKSETAHFSKEAVFMKNGVRLSAFVSDDIRPLSGSLRLLDHNDDGAFDVVFAEDYLDFAVEKVVDHTVFFKNGLLNGKNYVTLELEDKNYNHILLDDETMEPAQVGQVRPGNAVSVFYGSDEKIKVILSRSVVSGVVSEQSEDRVVINGSQYKIACDPYGNPLVCVDTGEQVNLLLNFKNHIVGKAGAQQQTEQYGYIIQAATKNGLSGEAQFKMLEAAQEKPTARNKSDRPVTEVFNKGIKILTGAPKIHYGDQRLNGKQLVDEINQILSIKKGAAAKYYLDSNGKINKMELLTSDGLRSTLYNSDVKAYGSGYIAGSQMFKVSEATAVFVVPPSAVTDEDYLTHVELAHRSSISAEPFQIDPETEVAQAVVLHAEASAAIDPRLDNIAIISQVSRVLDELGETYKISGYTKGAAFSAVSSLHEELSAACAQIRTGDVVYYRADVDGKLTFIQKVAQLSDGTLLSNPLLTGDPEAAAGAVQYLGQITNVTYNRLAENSFLYLANRITLDGTRSIHMPLGRYSENILPAYIYVYDTVKNMVSAGNISDVSVSFDGKTEGYALYKGSAQRDYQAMDFVVVKR